MNNVILFPKTIPYLEEQLTRYLQTEQYREGLELLQRMLQYPNIDQDKADQWTALLYWIQTMHPETVFSDLELQEEEEQEEDLLRQYVQEKTLENTVFVEKLLKMLQTGTLEQQVIALEQLAFVEQKRASDTLRSWLTATARHPHIQFKALQALKQMGEKGYIELPKNGQRIAVEIEETPLTTDEFPSQIREMIARVGEISEANQPDFAFFAKQTWSEFLSYVYGTSVYSELIKQDEANVDLWASALHVALMERMYGSAHRQELLDMYGIVDASELPWTKAYSALRKFIEALMPDNR